MGRRIDNPDYKALYDQAFRLSKDLLLKNHKIKRDEFQKAALKELDGDELLINFVIDDVIFYWRLHPKQLR